MCFENTLLKFQISVPFVEWATVYESEENIKLNIEHGIISLYKGLKKNDPKIERLIELGKEEG